jgi:hypothetical protein
MQLIRLDPGIGSEAVSTSRDGADKLGG